MTLKSHEEKHHEHIKQADFCAGRRAIKSHLHIVAHLKYSKLDTMRNWKKLYDCISKYIYSRG